MAEKVYIFDTTLRDGEQSPGASMNIEEKLQVAKQLAKLGVDVIEAGFPIASEGDFEAVKEIAMEVSGPQIAALARTNEEDIVRAWEAIKYSKNPRIHTFIATSDIHLEYKLRISREEALEKAVKAVELARSFTENVEFSAEDATRSDWDFLVKIFTEAIRAGATVINVPDTVGYTVPEEYYNLIKYLKENVPNIDKAMISVHCHNDLGLAVANSLYAIKAGARQVEATINGIGERAGNASMEEIVMILKVRKDLFPYYTDIVTEQIYPTSRLLQQITGIKVQPNKAIVGDNAFAHESGIHQDGVLKKAITYEIMTPQSVGWPTNKLVLGKHSGRHAFKEFIEQMGYELSDDQFNKAFKLFKALADKKKRVYEEDIEALIAEEILRLPEKYNFISANITSGTDMLPVGTVILEIEGKKVKEADFGDGPVDAIYNAIKKATGKDDVHLVRFDVSSITGGTDAIGEVTVRIEENGKVAMGQGTDTDILVAAAKAFINALNKLELRRRSWSEFKKEGI